MKLVISVLVGCSALALAPPSRAVEPDATPPNAAPSNAALPSSAASTKGISGSAEVGDEYRTLFAVPIHALELRGALGPTDALDRRFMPMAFTSVLLGRTPAGLIANRVVLGARVEARGRYYYAGASFALGYFYLRRAMGGSMGNGEALGELCLGLQFPLGSHMAFSLEGRLTGEFLPGTDDALMLGPGVGVRLRFY